MLFYGFDFQGKFTDSDNYSLDELVRGYREATNQEVEEALIKEAKRRGLVDECVINDSNICGFEVYDYKIDNFSGYVMDAFGCELNIKQKKDGVESLRTIFKDGVWAEVRVGEPFFKPEEPKIEDVCKFWDDDESESVVGQVGYIDNYSIYPYQLKYGDWYKNAKPITKEEAIKLLFGYE